MHKKYSQGQDFGVPQETTVNFLVNHGYNHPQLQFWTQYKCWRFTWCFMILAHNLKPLRKCQWKARTPILQLTNEWLCLFLCFSSWEMPKESHGTLLVPRAAVKRENVSPVEHPGPFPRKSVPRLTKSLLYFRKYQGERNMKKEKSHQHSKRMLMKENRLELRRGKF